jgi:ribonuclease G
MEMTRQRLHESIGSALYEPCPACKGHGQVKTPLTMSVDIQRRISSILQRGRTEQKDLVVVVHPDVMQRLRTEDGELLAELQRKYQAKLAFRVDPSYQREQFMVAIAATGEEIKN